VTQAYRPVLYASLTPFGSITRVDPALHASRGYNADFGWRGTLADVLKFDAGAFYLWYGNRVGTRTITDATGATFSEHANIGNSVHTGLEAYLEFDPLRPANASPRAGALDIFTSFAYVDARYVSGEFRHNRVEQAPRVVDRTGITYTLGRVASTLQASYTASSFGDANNSATPVEDTEAGLVPAYTVWDWSGRVRITSRAALTFGVNNLLNTRYFTKRTGEYPGPGILPGLGRSIYTGVSIGR
jgi:Fe(3+) dicitrate transport protein